VIARNSFVHADLKHLSELDHCSVEPGEPDPRGWTVFMSDEQRIGTVIDLLVDRDEQTNGMNVRYLVIDVDGGALPGVSESGQTALVRAEDVDLDGGLRRVTARAIACDDIHRVRPAEASNPLKRTEEDRAPVTTV
jgi:hypothetical protein